MRETIMRNIIRLFVLGSIFASSACEQGVGDVPAIVTPENASADKPLLELSKVTGLAIIDVSVPFERLREAPMRLRRIADALNNGSAGLYVMRYYDDSLQHTSHIFVIGESGTTYIEITSRVGEHPNRTEFDIINAAYDEQTNTLVLRTVNGDIRLSPANVTPMGA